MVVNQIALKSRKKYTSQNAKSFVRRYFQGYALQKLAHYNVIKI